MARSINQNNQSKLLPDFRNMGAVLRIVLAVNVIALVDALAQAISLNDTQEIFLRNSALLQPVLLCSLLLLYALNTALRRARYWQAATAVVAVVVATAWGLESLGGELFATSGEIGAFGCLKHALESATISLLLLGYFRLRAQALFPAKDSARLQALQARIRPHFLFNTINAVLSIVRANPKRAESALEDMADLFRTAMLEPQEMVALNKEVELARQYLSIEELRLGERLNVRWEIADMPPDALIPPLILQPLLENAVYHGIEPLPQGGTIEIGICRNNGELHLEVGNPVQARASTRVTGHKIALSNIRERLALLFDVEAQYQVENDGKYYRVHIRIPYVKGQHA